MKQAMKFTPYQKVLVRDTSIGSWRCDFYSYTNCTTHGDEYVCVGGRHNYCIPYEGNEALLGTTDSPQPKRWRAEIGEYYYRIFISFDGVHIWEKLEDGKKESDCYYQNNNYFRTKEEAQAMADQIKAILKEE